jgi:hypothetical protein
MCLSPCRPGTYGTRRGCWDSGCWTRCWRTSQMRRSRRSCPCRTRASTRLTHPFALALSQEWLAVQDCLSYRGAIRSNRMQTRTGHVPRPEHSVRARDLAHLEHEELRLEPARGDGVCTDSGRFGRHDEEDGRTRQAVELPRRGWRSR